LVEEQAQGIYPFDRRDLSVELEELHEHMAGVVIEYAIEFVQLSGTSLRIQSQLRMFWLWPVSFWSACRRSMLRR
jgi:hypothetical protein